MLDGEVVQEQEQEQEKARDKDDQKEREAQIHMMAQLDLDRGNTNPWYGYSMACVVRGYGRSRCVDDCTHVSLAVFTGLWVT